jgi:glycosyltransferase involved in cell wall biosynthesis
VRASIVVNTYNHERFAREAIDSALAQTHDDLEVIVVDDGSSDDTPRIVDSFGDAVVAVLKTNGGQASAINAGFARTSGDFVVFLDGDDLLYPSAASRIADVVAPTTGKVHWPLDVIGEGGERTGEVFPRRPLPEGDFRQYALTNPPPFVLSPPTSGNAWSRAFLETALPMPEEPFFYGADTYLFELAPLFGPVALIAEPQGAYRRHASSGHDALPLAAWLPLEIGWYEVLFPALTQYAARLGLAADERAWREGSWFYRLAGAIAELRALLPAQARIAVGDGGAWGLDDELDGWRFVQFPANGEEYGYAPADDEHAVVELEKLPARADYFVLAWPAFWWRDLYTGFDACLRERWECLYESEQVAVYRVA